MKFENVLFGNELQTWTGSSFVAPVNGVYVFNIQLVSQSSGRSYRLSALINNGDDGVDQLQENSRKDITDGQGHSSFFQIERELKIGDTLTIKDDYADNRLYDYSEHKCSTNDKEHSCSYITGRLIKKL